MYLRRTLLIFLLATAAYAALLVHPNWAFAHSYEHNNVTIYSDQEIASDIEQRVSAALQKLERSELFDPDMEFNIYICNSPYRLGFFGRNPKVGGIVNGIISENVFIRESDIVGNKIIPPGTWLLDEANRTLTYFLAHEMTHAMQFRHYRFMQLTHPSYLSEGYADYIAKGLEFDYEGALSDYRSGHEFYSDDSPLYNRQHLAIAYLIEEEQHTYREIMSAPSSLDAVLRKLE